LPLVVRVAALQFMLDEGKDLDWFSSTEICVLSIVAAIGFLSFLIWGHAVRTAIPPFSDTALDRFFECGKEKRQQRS
jgi:hypothetical protein